MTDNTQSIIDLGREAAGSNCKVKDLESQMADFVKDLKVRKEALNKAIAGAFAEGTDLSMFRGGASKSKLCYPQHKTLIVLIEDAEYVTPDGEPHKALAEIRRKKANVKEHLKKLELEEKQEIEKGLLRGTLKREIKRFKTRFDSIQLG